jgi:hypothetical protein
VDLKAGLNDLEKRKFLTLPGLELQPVACRYSDYAIPAPRIGSIRIISSEKERDPRKLLVICGESNRMLAE